MAEENTTVDYEKNKIKTYDNWDLYLYSKQNPLIGRCYAWAKRDADLVTDMNEDERSELFTKVIPEWNTAVKQLYNHSRPNISCLGNNVPHLHWHLIPRYDEAINVYGSQFRDSDSSRNYVHVKKSKLSEEVHMRIRDDISSAIKCL